MYDKTAENETKIAKTYLRTYSMKGMEIVRELKLTANDILSNLYIYVNIDGDLDYMYMHDRRATPIDEAASLGYVQQITGMWVNEIRAALK